MSSMDVYAATVQRNEISDNCIHEVSSVLLLIKYVAYPTTHCSRARAVLIAL